ncbi:conjugal transfer protein TraB [Bosea sp. MMO-172]|uniref:conjugal transfer protein TraB n=1 Tax=Bosea sp. MMO-172 TaxID=3127885 RepID=UPI0030185B1F
MTPGISGWSRRPVFSDWHGRSSSSIPDRFHALVLVAAAVAAGGIGWSGHALTLPMAMVFPALWAASRDRLTAAAVAVGYFLAASRGLPAGVASYFSTSVWAGVLLWFCASLGFIAVHAAVWSSGPGRVKALRYLTAAVLMAVPPFGIVGWAHPITAAGVLFPGWGWWGLAAATSLLLAMTTRAWPLAAAVMVGFWIWSALSWSTPPTPIGWLGIDTALSSALGEGNVFDQHRVLAGRAARAADGGANVVVFPESTLGVLTPTVARYWADSLAGRPVTVIAGVAVLDADGYGNAMVAIEPSGARIPYRSRMPVPVSMWQPWRAWLGASGGAQATFFGDPVVDIAGRKVAPLICYEQLLVWPVLQSMLERPDAIVAIANGWWAIGTSIPDIQIAALEAWARLFAIPLVTAFNR